MNHHRPLPMLNGIKPSYLVLPHDKRFDQQSLLHFLCIHFPFVEQATWQSRLNSGMVVDQHGQPLNEHSPFQAGSTIYYYRQISRDNETPIPFKEQILLINQHLVVVDKPHFLPVIPSGRFLHETLLTRLRLRAELQHLNIADLTPIHRLDKDTAGVMLFSHNAQTRATYQTMFQNQSITKIYHAIAPTRLDLDYPYTVQSRLVRGDQFFLTKQIDGLANAQTHIQLLEHRGDNSLYELTPITGKKHQLRVHMMSLGMPIVNDMLYPVVQAVGTENHHQPLQLLAKKIEFRDPLSGCLQVFESKQAL